MSTETPIDLSDDQASLAICAIRYCIGRQSYITDDGQRWAREYGRRSTHVRETIVRDLESEIASIEKTGKVGTLGMASDEIGWRKVLTELRGMA